MKPVSELLKRRNSAVWRIEPGATMFDAWRRWPATRSAR